MSDQQPNPDQLHPVSLRQVPVGGDGPWAGGVQGQDQAGLADRGQGLPFSGGICGDPGTCGDPVTCGDPTTCRDPTTYDGVYH